MKTISAPSLLAILLLSTCTPSYTERNIPKGIVYSVFTAVFGTSTILIGGLSYEGIKNIIKNPDRESFYALFAATIGTVATGWKTYDCFIEAYKNLKEAYKNREKESLKKVAKEQ